VTQECSLRNDSNVLEPLVTHMRAPLLPYSQLSFSAARLKDIDERAWVGTVDERFDDLAH